MHKLFSCICYCSLSSHPLKGVGFPAHLDKTLYESLWPHVKGVYKKHYGDLLNPKLLDNIRFELDQIYHTATQYVHPVCFGIVNLAFRSCIHAAEQWNFSIEE